MTSLHVVALEKIEVGDTSFTIRKYLGFDVVMIWARNVQQLGFLMTKMMERKLVLGIRYRNKLSHKPCSKNYSTTSRTISIESVIKWEMEPSTNALWSCPAIFLVWQIDMEMKTYLEELLDIYLHNQRWSSWLLPTKKMPVYWWISSSCRFFQRKTPDCKDRPVHALEKCKTNSEFEQHIPHTCES